MAELQYGPDGPTESDVRLIGPVSGKRVLDLGCGDGAAAVTLAQQGAVVIAVDASEARLQRASRRAEEQDVRLEWRTSDLADLAFLARGLDRPRVQHVRGRHRRRPRAPLPAGATGPEAERSVRLLARTPRRGDA